MSLSFLPSPHEWHASQPALLSSPLLSLERAEPSSPPSPPALCFFQTPVTHPGLQKHWWISNLLCASLPACFYSTSLAATTCCSLHRGPCGEAEERRTGERANWTRYTGSLREQGSVWPPAAALWLRYADVLPSLKCGCVWRACELCYLYMTGWSFVVQHCNLSG